MALDQLEATLKKQWRLGQSIVLCWVFDPNGLLTIVVPHYFLGNFSSPNHPSRDELLDMSGLRVDEKQLSDIRFESWSAGQSEERLIEVTDKHGMSQGADNVGFAIELEGLPLALGMRKR